MRLLIVLVPALLVMLIGLPATSNVDEAEAHYCPGAPEEGFCFVSHVWGDTHCDDDIESTDALNILSFLAYGVMYTTHDEPCFTMNAPMSHFEDSDPPHHQYIYGDFGDVNCSGTITASDAYVILAYLAGESYVQYGNCPALGLWGSSGAAWA